MTRAALSSFSTQLQFCSASAFFPSRLPLPALVGLEEFLSPSDTGSLRVMCVLTIIPRLNPQSNLIHRLQKSLPNSYTRTPPCGLMQTAAVKRSGRIGASLQLYCSSANSSLSGAHSILTHPLRLTRELSFPIVLVWYLSFFSPTRCTPSCPLIRQKPTNCCRFSF